MPAIRANRSADDGLSGSPLRSGPDRRTLLSLGTLALAAPALAGCAPKVEPPFSEKPEIQRRLKFGLPAPVFAMDPAIASDIESRRILRQCLQTLIGTDPATGAAVPRLALRYSVSENGRRVEFRLRQGIRFHDGSTFNAATVRDNFERLYRLPRAIYEANPVNDFRRLFRAHADEASASLYAGSEVLADDVVVLKTTQPIQGILPALSQIGFGILSSRQIQERKAAGAGAASDPGVFTPIGTGPFSVASASRMAVSLSRFEANLPSKIAVTGIDFTVHEDESSRLEGLLKGRLDAFDLVTPRMAAALARNAMRTQTRDPFSLLYLGMNSSHPVLKNPEIRRIISRVIARQPLISGQFLNGTKPAENFFPPRLGIESSLFPPLDPQLSPAEARTALEKAGYRGQRIEFVYPLAAPRIYMPYPERTYALLGRQLQAAGLNIKPVPIEWGDGYVQKMLARKGRGFHLLGLNGGYQDQGYFVNTLFQSPKEEFGFEDTSLAEMLQKALTVPDPDARKAAYVEISARLAELVPAVPLVLPVSALAASTGVMSLPASPVLDEVLDGVRFAEG